MPLRTLVKVGNISNLSDARYCAGMGVDFLGFSVIEGQPNAISVAAFQEIRGWVTGPQIVAEIYGIANSAALAQIIENFRPDFIELGIAEFSTVGQFLTLPFILKLKAEEELPAMPGKPAYLIADENEISRFVPDHDVLLMVNSAAELDHSLSHTGVSGVCIHGGGVEIRPGLKTYDELADILEALEID